jgi:RNA polymerase sigma-B factor
MTPHAALAAYLAGRTPANRDRLVTAYWYLCLRGAKKFWRTGIDRADLAQVGAIGLLKAVHQFDAELRTPFEAYAWLLVVGELMHYVRDHERIVRIPRALRALEKRYALVTHLLSSRLGRTPTPAEIGAELGVEPAIVDELRLLRHGCNVVSLEAYTGSPTGELASIAAPMGVDERLSLHTAIDELAERERVAVLGSFAAGLSQAQLGQRLGISQSQVSKVIKRALDKLHAQVA